MRCPFTDELHTHELNTGDPRVAEHLLSCAACRAEWDGLQAMQAMLTALPELDVPGAVAAHVQTTVLPAASLSCDDTLDLLEAYREGELDAAQTFLVEEHLLWCEDCAQALDDADRLTALLTTLPVEPAPAAIAERIAAARQPWWQRLLPPTPAWGLGYAAAAAALVVTLVSGLVRPLATTVAKHPVPRPTPVVQPAVNVNTPAVTVTPPDKVTTPSITAKVLAVTAPAHTSNTSSSNTATQPAPPPPAAPAPRYRPTALVRTLTPHAGGHREYDASRADARNEAAPRAPESASPDYTASAREDLLRMAEEEELASIEESLSNAPEVMVASAVRRRPEVASAASASAIAEARAEELRKGIVDDLRRRNVPTNPKPIVIRNDGREKRAGVLVTIQ